jgi:tRNA pseudouridine38-40 synthase
MARYKVILAYDGTAFSGMQRQDNSRSVQSVVEDVLRSLGWTGLSILVAGRTDAGVHACGQVIAFDLDWRHSPETLLKALNAELHQTVAARSVSLAADDFHPRYDAKARTYEYRIICQPLRDPLRERYAWRVWPAPKLRRLKAAAKMLRGEHDFAKFGTPPKKGGSTERKVLRAQWRQETEDEFVFTVKANAFLYHMARHMVGLQMKVGQGLLEASAIENALSGKSSKVRELAPAHGLTLIDVQY